MRTWRAKHPASDAWNCHKQNAKKRGVVVIWTRAEFLGFCADTGYHVLRKDGYEIHRKKEYLGYFLDNCACIKKEVHSRFTSVERKLNRLRAARLAAIR